MARVIPTDHTHTEAEKKIVVWKEQDFSMRKKRYFPWFVVKHFYSISLALLPRSISSFEFFLFQNLGSTSYVRVFVITCSSLKSKSHTERKREKKVRIKFFCTLVVIEKESSYKGVLKEKNFLSMRTVKDTRSLNIEYTRSNLLQKGRKYF